MDPPLLAPTPCCCCPRYGDSNELWNSLDGIFACVVWDERTGYFCVARDPKGIYKRAQAGQLKQLLDYPFGEPRPRENAHHVDTVAYNVDECYQMILETARGHLGRD